MNNIIVRIFAGPTTSINSTAYYSSIVPLHVSYFLTTYSYSSILILLLYIQIIRLTSFLICHVSHFLWSPWIFFGIFLQSIFKYHFRLDLKFQLTHYSSKILTYYSKIVNNYSRIVTVYIFPLHLGHFIISPLQLHQYIILQVIISLFEEIIGLIYGWIVSSIFTELQRGVSLPASRTSSTTCTAGT